MKKTLVHLFVIIALLLVSPLICSAGLLTWDQMCKITSPTATQKLSSSPVQITTQLNAMANPGTFKAWLNGQEITSKFVNVTSGMAAIVDTSDGLRTGDSESSLRDRINILVTEIRGYRKEIDIDTRVFFVKDDPPELVTELLSSALASGSVKRALSFVEPSRRTKFELLFQTLGTSGMAEVAAVLQTAKPVFVGAELAEYEGIITLPSGENILGKFTMIKTPDGWKIDGL